MDDGQAAGELTAGELAAGELTEEEIGDMVCAVLELRKQASEKDRLAGEMFNRCVPHLTHGQTLDLTDGLVVRVVDPFVDPNGGAKTAFKAAARDRFDLKPLTEAQVRAYRREQQARDGRDPGGE